MPQSFPAARRTCCWFAPTRCGLSHERLHHDKGTRVATDSDGQGTLAVRRLTPNNRSSIVTNEEHVLFAHIIDRLAAIDARLDRVESACLLAGERSDRLVTAVHEIRRAVMNPPVMVSMGPPPPPLSPDAIDAVLGATYAANSTTPATLGRRGGLRGGPARARGLSPERRREIAVAAARARWGHDNRATDDDLT